VEKEGNHRAGQALRTKGEIRSINTTQQPPPDSQAYPSSFKEGRELESG
jgi:hypothetical protein